LVEVLFVKTALVPKRLVVVALAIFADPAVRNEVLRLVEDAFVAKELVEVALDDIKLVKSPFVAENPVVKKLVVVALVITPLTAEKLVVVALVVVRSVKNAEIPDTTAE